MKGQSVEARRERLLKGLCPIHGAAWGLVGEPKDVPFWNQTARPCCSRSNCGVLLDYVPDDATGTATIKVIAGLPEEEMAAIGTVHGPDPCSAGGN